MQGLLLMALLAGAGGVCAASETPSSVGPVAPGGFVHLETSHVPLALPAEERLERARRTAAANRPGPPVTKRWPGAAIRPGASSIDTGEPRAAASTFRVIQDDDLRAVVPPADTSGIGEPCAVRAGHDVLVVGNWYAARATDGHTYGWMDPAVQFPGVNGGFCCDQNVVYDPVRGLFIWELLYSPDPNSNTVRIAYASTAEMEADQWHWVDVTPANLNASLPPRLWLDYPQLSLSHGFLHLTANLFEIGRDVFNASVAIRMPLDKLAAGTITSADFEKFIDATHFTLTPVQGADDVMYFATQEAGTFGLHIYRWPDASPVPTSFGVAVRGYAPTAMVCEGPDGRDWCSRSDDRVMTGWVAGGLLGFMWNAAQDVSHPFPYVRVARIDESTGTKVDEPDLVRSDTAYQYPAVAVNAAGHLGGAVAIGGGALRYPGTAVFLADDLTTGGLFEVHDVVTGDSGPSNGEWGDFLCSRPEAPEGTTWVTTAYALRGGTGGANVHPHVVCMGRERDITSGPDDPCPDDGESCTTAVCTSARCSSPALADGSNCPAPDACALTSPCAACI